MRSHFGMPCHIFRDFMNIFHFNLRERFCMKIPHIEGLSKDMLYNVMNLLYCLILMFECIYDM